MGGCCAIVKVVPTTVSTSQSRSKNLFSFHSYPDLLRRILLSSEGGTFSVCVAIYLKSGIRIPLGSDLSDRRTGNAKSTGWSIRLQLDRSKASLKA